MCVRRPSFRPWTLKEDPRHNLINSILSSTLNSANMLRSIPRAAAVLSKPSAFAGLRFKHTLPGNILIFIPSCQILARVLSIFHTRVFCAIADLNLYIWL